MSIAHNTTFDPTDLATPELAPTAARLRRWVWRWLLRGRPLGVNGAVKHRAYVRPHKLWEYTKGLALSQSDTDSASDRHSDRPVPGGPLHVLDVGGAMTLPVFYLAGLGHRVTTLDVDASLTAQTDALARRAGLPVDARTTDLTRQHPTPADLGAPPEGFDRVLCFCVIEHIVPPHQQAACAGMARLLRPGGVMVLTFDFGEHAPTEAPLRTSDDVAALAASVGLPLVGGPFVPRDGRYPLDRRHPEKPYTFGSLFFRKPA